MEISVFQTRAAPLAPRSGPPITLASSPHSFRLQPAILARLWRLKFHCTAITRIQGALVFLKCPAENTFHNKTHLNLLGRSQTRKLPDLKQR